MWISAGPGNFELSSERCAEPALYALVTTEWSLAADCVDRTAGWRGTASPVQPPGEYFGSFKHTSYLPHVLAKLEAEARGYDQVGGRAAGVLAAGGGGRGLKAPGQLCVEGVAGRRA